MRKILHILKKIDLKRGSASAPLGLAVILLGYICVIVILSMFSALNYHTKIQIISDVVGDGATVAANTTAGFDVEKMNDVANALIEYNNIEGVYIDNITVEDELDALGNATGSKIVTSKINGETDLYIPAYLGYDTRFQMSATSIIRVDPVTTSDGLLNVNFIDAPNLRPPFETSAIDKRNGAYVTWFINYYLNPENNGIYANGISENFVYDYLICMGFTKEEIIGMFSPSLLVDCLEDFFAGEGWTTTTNREEIIAAANAGKPVVIYKKYNDENEEIYVSVVVPARSVINETEVPTAGVGAVNWNYKIENFEDLINQENTVIFLHE